MPVSVEDVKGLSICGEFDCIADSAIQLAINDAAKFVGGDWCPDYVDCAQRAAAAHILLKRMEGGAGAAGPVTSAKADGISVSFAAPASSSSWRSWWRSTSYGQEFLQYFDLQPVTPRAACDVGASGVAPGWPVPWR